jgi:hypothetical protein
MRKFAGVILLIVSGVPMVFLPFVVVWAILECGPINSSCHHTPYRLLGLIAACLAVGSVGVWLVVGPRRRA